MTRNGKTGRLAKKERLINRRHWIRVFSRSSGCLPVRPPNTIIPAFWRAWQGTKAISQERNRSCRVLPFTPDIPPTAKETPRSRIRFASAANVRKREGWTVANVYTDHAISGAA